MRRNFTLSNLDADQVARDVTAALFARMNAAAAGLTPVAAIHDGGADASGTRVYKLVRALVRYAQGGQRPAAAGAAQETLGRWLGAEATSTTTKTKTPLQLVLTAVEAREALEAGQPLTSPQVAALCDLDRDHVNGMACRGEIPGAYRSDETAHLPWRFRGAAFRRWLAARIRSDQALLAEVAS